LTTPLTSDEVAQLYRRYAPLVHARARRLVRDEADDVVHEVFVRLLRRPPTGEQTLAWLLVTTTNVCLDRLRARARRDDGWLREARAALGDGEVTIEGLVEAKEACRLLLGRFDDKTARIVAMTLVDGMSQEEVASLFGVTRTAVAKRLQRFLRDARAILGVARERPDVSIDR
jgi:RNA polymerase sigma-70 factor (ECF subfamily)